MQDSWNRQYPHEDIYGRVQTLKGVRYVPGQRKNLHMLGSLETQGYKFTGTDESPKVIKSFMMILKTESIANLYKVIESMVIGDSSITTEEEDTTRLWHMRLRYMIEQGLRALHSKKVLLGIKHYKLKLCNFYIIGKQ